MTAEPESRMFDQLPAQSPSDLGAAEFEALLNAAVDGIVVTDETGRILRFNRSAERMFGYTAKEVTGQSVDMIMTDRDRDAHSDYIDNYLRTGIRKIIGIGREVQARHRDGTEFTVSISVGEVRLENRIRFVGLIRDLTKQKQAEEEALRHREQMMHVSRLTTMGEMAAAMAHELNQPLSAIATYTAACARFLEKGEDAREDILSALQEIGVQAHRAGEVIQRIRDFARSREFARSSVEIKELIDEILPLAELDARANRVRLTVDIAGSLPDVIADPVQVQQVILNLLRNGVDAMLDAPEQERRLILRASADADQNIRFEITDHGQGVTAEDRKHLFTPFFTTKAAGMGMGLAISRSIITAHGGKLDCENNSDRGATFFFTLPASLEN